LKGIRSDSRIARNNPLVGFFSRPANR